MTNMTDWLSGFERYSDTLDNLIHFLTWYLTLSTFFLTKGNWVVPRKRSATETPYFLSHTMPLKLSRIFLLTWNLSLCYIYLPNPTIPVESGFKSLFFLTRALQTLKNRGPDLSVGPIPAIYPQVFLPFFMWHSSEYPCHSGHSPETSPASLCLPLKCDT